MEISATAHAAEAFVVAKHALFNTALPLVNENDDEFSYKSSSVASLEWPDL